MYELNSQEENLIKDVLKRTIEDEFCDETTKQVVLSILNKFKENE